MPADDTQQQDQQDQREADQQDQHQNDDAHDDESSELGDKGKAALQREREARKAAERRAADVEKRLAEIEKQQREAEESTAREQGKWEEIAKAREDELAELRHQIADRDLTDRKRAVAKAHDIPDDLIDRIKGETDEELETDAKALAKWIKAKDAPENDAGEHTKPGYKRRDKSKFADPARWGLR